jgi:cyclopropane fatty-acyl-phospholipid synthase-like methyltransferase
MKEYAPACDRNSQHILEVLAPILARSRLVLEIGAGTGQHAVCFAQALPHLNWLPGNRESLASIQAWRDEAALENLLPPRNLDLLATDIDKSGLAGVDAIVCINTIHIMPWEGTQRLFALAAEILPAGGLLYVYGPYRYVNRDLEPSNENFDQWLKQRDPRSGIRDFEAVDGIARNAGFVLEDDVAMPANNRSIWWRKT